MLMYSNIPLLRIILPQLLFRRPGMWAEVYGAQQPVQALAAAAGVVMRVGSMARCRCCGHFGRGQCLHVEAQGPDFLGNVACSISATCAARQRQRLICKINLYI